MSYEEVVLRNRLVTTGNQLAQAKAEIERWKGKYNELKICYEMLQESHNNRKDGF